MRMVIKRLRRLTAAILGIALTTCAVTYAADMSGASAISRTDQAQTLRIVNYLAGSGFTAEQKVSREEFCVVISKIFYGLRGSDTALPFEDAAQVKSESVPYLAALYDADVLKGSLTDGKLKMLPDETITRQEAFTLLGRLLGKSSDKALGYTDADTVAGYAYPYIAWFTENGILVGYPDGTIGPKELILGGHMSLFVLRAVDVKYNGRYITTLAGTGLRGFNDGPAHEARFTLPYGVAVTRDGIPVVLDTYSNAIRTVKNGEVITLVGKTDFIDDHRYAKGYYLDGQIDEALLNRPVSGVFNANGDFIFADSRSSAIRIVLGDHVYTLSGSTPGYAEGNDMKSQYNEPMALAIDDAGIVYVADTLNNCIRKVDSKGNSAIVAGSSRQAGYADGGVNTALFNEPSGIAVSGDGKTIYVADTGNHVIRKIYNGTVTTIAGAPDGSDGDGMPFGGFANGTGTDARFDRPCGLELAGGLLLVSDSGNNAIRAVRLATGKVMTVIGNGEAGDEFGIPGGATLNQPNGICYDDGLLYIADTGNNKIKVALFDAAGYEESIK